MKLRFMTVDSYEPNIRCELLFHFILEMKVFTANIFLPYKSKSFIQKVMHAVEQFFCCQLCCVVADFALINKMP